MSNGHTPGPWSIDKEERWVIHEPEGKSGTLVVPEIYLDDDEAIANARLIAASPCMYALLEKRADQGDEEARNLIRRISNG